MAAFSSGRVGEELSADTISYLIHHIFLPPQLPQSDDRSLQSEQLLLRAVIDGLAEYKNHLPADRRELVGAAVHMLCNMQSVHHVSGDVGEAELRAVLAKLDQTGSSIPLHIRAQNAGVFISKTEEGVQFETFELSPLTEAVVTTKGRLQRSFPAAAVNVSMGDYHQAGFDGTIAQALSAMSITPVVGMQPNVKKAGEKLDEDRNTTHPGIVTEVFTNFLLAMGTYTSVTAVSKNTRDEVLWKDARSPWRRSAKWLLIRVTLQLTLTRASGSGSLYKEAIVFVMSYILKSALKLPLHNDILHVMRAKIARRVCKLGSAIDDNILCFIQRIVEDCSNVMAARWLATQQHSTPRIDLRALPALDFDHDSSCCLPDLDAHIDAMGRRQSTSNAGTFVPSSGLVKCRADSLPCLQSIDVHDSAYIVANLQEVESWVASYSRQWSRAHANDTGTCRALGSLITGYHAMARWHYDGNPEALSIMVLTILELWVACDEAAVSFTPLLHDYKPGVRKDTLQSLLLPFRHHMERLRDLEEYLVCRISRALYPYSMIFLDVTNLDCFAAKCFDQSLLHQKTLQDIIDQAEKAQQRKFDELKRKKLEYQEYMRLYNDSECELEYVVLNHDNGTMEQQHKVTCARCQNKFRAESLKIDIHEWPLPSNDTKAKAVVFELQLPASFGSWRDATFYVLRDMLKAEYSSSVIPRADYRLSTNDPHLHRFFRSLGAMRIGLLSEDKPHACTHRKTQLISTAHEGSVCLPNALNYRYFDSTTGDFVHELRHTNQAADEWTYRLQSRSAALDKYLFRPTSTPNGPAPNEVLANQFECPDHMSLEEFYSLCHLPLGYRIQWQNILLQLGAPAVDLKKAETAMFVFQCIYQAGPRNDINILRETHAILDDGKYASALLKSLDIALDRIKENWESAQALNVFSTVAGRLLSLTSSTHIQQKCYDFLRKLQQVAFRWVSILQEQVQQAVKQGIREETRSKSVEVALICALCFDVDDAHLANILNTSHDA